MQKKVFILVLALILLVGCTKIDNSDLKHADYVVSCLGNKKNTNNVALGYKYYLPIGIKIVEDFDYNQKFRFDDTYLYMFVDINGYYFKKDYVVSKDDDDYYFQSISYGGKHGWLKIVKDGDKYFTRVLYNYAKIEFYSDKEDINKLLTISSIILNSIKYNKIVIERVLDENSGSSKEFSYELYKPVDASNKFSQYLEEYVKEKDKKEKLPDE
ncbi:MAG: hypothetical protein VZS44_00885 [Bacilli bacterium]|nr:hypothetical protein [Bacilli bacterium]